MIYEWTTPEERQALLQTLVERGSEALYDALQDQSEKGYVQAPRTLGYDCSTPGSWRWRANAGSCWPPTDRWASSS